MKVAEKLSAEIEIIPGITSAATLSAKLKLALTDREKSSGVIFITGHSKAGCKLEEAYNWEAIAKLNLTIVIYMGIKNMPLISKLLMENGMKAEVPVILGEKLETESERILRTTLFDVARCIETNNIKHPTTTIIGEIFK
jgi:uroporphyrin-III C-methyltransferase